VLALVNALANSAPAVRDRWCRLAHDVGDDLRQFYTQRARVAAVHDRSAPLWRAASAGAVSSWHWATRGVPVRVPA